MSFKSFKLHRSKFTLVNSADNSRTIKGFKLHRSKFTQKIPFPYLNHQHVSNSIGVNLHVAYSSGTAKKVCFKLHRSKFTLYEVLGYGEYMHGFKLHRSKFTQATSLKVKSLFYPVSNSIGVNLHEQNETEQADDLSFKLHRSKFTH